MTRRSLIVLTLFLFALIPALHREAVAQESQAITYIAVYKVRPGKGGDFLNYARTNWQPVFEKLRSEGTVLVWGVDTKYIHSGQEPQHSLWWTVPNYTALEKTEAALDALRQKTTPQQTAAFMEITDPEMHRDFLMRSLVFRMKPTALGTPAFISVNWQRVQPGKGAEWRRLWDQYTKPTLDKLYAEGTILGYGLDVEEYHTAEPQWRYIWVTVPTLAAFDNVDAAFDAENQRRSEAERTKIGQQFREVLVLDAHRDELWRQMIFASGK